MSPIVFEVHGEPKPQPRPRAFARQTAFGTIARVYDAGTAEGWKSLVAEAARPFIPEAPLSCPLALYIDFWLPRPNGHFVASKRERGLKANAPTYHTARGDVDNFSKAVMDCLTVLRLWQDDGQVADLTVSKRYEDPATGPGALIRIAALESVEPRVKPEQPSLLEEASL
jgi:Holliday junction resolvase RusA-like endonuclease